MIRQLRPHQYVVDALVGIAYFLSSLFLLQIGSRFPYLAIEFSNLGVLVIAGYAIAIAISRLSPALALALAWIFSLGQMSIGMYPNLYNVATLVVLFSTSAYGGRTVRWVGLASVGFGAFIAAGYLTAVGSGLGVSTTLLGWSDLPGVVLQFSVLFIAVLTALALPWLAGLLVRAIMRTKESTAARVVAEEVVIVEQERNRIARDMHDVVAHSLAVVVAQADGARYARAANPEAVDEALTAISTTAREALSDVRLLLAQLRYSDSTGPQPVLADLERLIEQMTASGLDIDFSEKGQAVALGTGQQLAVYRIVQEALTNALRHGDTTKNVRVLLDWTRSTINVLIENEMLRAAPSVTLGHGLAGMRERAALVGGSLTAEPAGARFVVAASIPIVTTHTGAISMEARS